jgi:hypothetical protein
VAVYRGVRALLFSPVLQVGQDFSHGHLAAIEEDAVLIPVPNEGEIEFQISFRRSQIMNNPDSVRGIALKVSVSKLRIRWR